MRYLRNLISMGIDVMALWLRSNSFSDVTERISSGNSLKRLKERSSLTKQSRREIFLGMVLQKHNLTVKQ